MNSSDAKRARAQGGAWRSPAECAFQGIVLLVLLISTNWATFTFSRRQLSDLSAYEPDTAAWRGRVAHLRSSSPDDLVGRLSNAVAAAEAALALMKAPGNGAGAAAQHVHAPAAPVQQAARPAPIVAAAPPQPDVVPPVRTDSVRYSTADVSINPPDFCDTREARESAARYPLPDAATLKIIMDGQWDGSSTWPATKREALRRVQCHKTTLKHWAIRLAPVVICTHDPTRDKVISEALHKWNWWGGAEDHEWVLAIGSGSGTPLTLEHSKRMREAARAAEAAGTPYTSVTELEKALALNPVPATDKVQSVCSRERPLMVDIGANIGLFSLFGAVTGCTVVSVEPMANNIGRLMQSAEENGVADSMYMFKNAVGKDKRLVTLDFNVGNPGATVVSETLVKGEAVETASQQHGEGGWGVVNKAGVAQETVATVILEELFDGSAQRPKHPFLSRPIAPGDIALLKVDIEGFDAIAFYSLRRTIQLGRPPYMKMEYEAGRIEYRCQCDNMEFLEWLYALGYHAYTLGLKRPLTLEDFRVGVLPLQLKKAKEEDIPVEHRVPEVKELYLVHDSAPVPAVMGATGPGGVTLV